MSEIPAEVAAFQRRTDDGEGWPHVAGFAVVDGYDGKERVGVCPLCGKTTERANRRYCQDCEITLSIDCAQRADAGESWTAMAREVGIALGRMKEVCALVGVPVREGQPRSAPTLTPFQRPEDLAYLAALIDGEGHLSRLPGKGRGPYWRVGVTNTHLGVIKWCASIGGLIYEEQRGEGRKTCYDWIVGARADVYVLLCSVAPYMKIKQERAFDAIGELRLLVPEKLVAREPEKPVTQQDEAEERAATRAAWLAQRG